MHCSSGGGRLEHIQDKKEDGFVGGAYPAEVMAPADAPNTEACTGAADTESAGFGTKTEAMERAPAAGRVSNTIHYVHPASSSAYQDESRADAHARHGRQADSTTSWSRAPSSQISNLALYLCMAPKGNFLRFLR